jgi:hypothetical protein
MCGHFPLHSSPLLFGFELGQRFFITNLLFI